MQHSAGLMREVTLPGAVKHQAEPLLQENGCYMS